MFHQILPSPQVKRWEIISFKHGTNDLPHELMNDLRLRNLGNLETLGKCLNFIERQPGAQPRCQNKNFVSTIKKVPKSRD